MCNIDNFKSTHTSLLHNKYFNNIILIIYIGRCSIPCEQVSHKQQESKGNRNEMDGGIYSFKMETEQIEYNISNGNLTPILKCYKIYLPNSITLKRDDIIKIKLMMFKSVI